MKSIMIKSRLLLIIFALVWIIPMTHANNETTPVFKGRVLDANTSEPLIGATVKVKDMTTGTVTDVDGNFLLTLQQATREVTVEVSYIGYNTQEITLKEDVDNLIYMSEDTQMLDEVQVVAYGVQSKVTLTGAVSSIGTKDLLKSPSGSVANALAGSVTGISTIQYSGQPGADDPEIYVRGTGSLTSEASKPLILVDGVERSFFQMDPNEIETITVLKDASSTAVFGVRGANGVILVTTRRGSSEKNQISVNSSFGLTQALRNMKGVDSYTYASLYNEAQRGDNPNLNDNQLKFSPFVIDMFRMNADPIMFPSVDWTEYLFNDLAWQTQHNATLSGGGERFRYFVSAGYFEQDGMLKSFQETYDPNFNYKRFNYRTNFDIDLTKDTQLKINVGGIVGNKRQPITYENFWKTIMWSLPFSSPGFVDGKLVMGPTSRTIPMEEVTSGLDIYYNWGYTTNTSNVLNLDFALNHDFSSVVKGLVAEAKGAYNTDYFLNVRRTPIATDSGVKPVYLGHLTQPGMDIADPRFDNNIVYQTDGVFGLKEPMNYGDYSGKSRNWYAEFNLNYNRSFGLHNVTGLLLYNQSKTYYPAQFTEIPTGYIGYVGRVTYNWNKKYMFELNAGYNGSENFAPEKRFGFFPAASVGWIISEENFMKKQDVIDFLKVRASYGIVGNDKYSGHRFMYLKGSWNGNHSVWSDGGSYQFGKDYSWDMVRDAKENTFGNELVTWEKVGKQNYGLEIRMLDGRLNVSGDLFYEKRKDILSTRNTLPAITAISLPMINLGRVNNHGYELALGWNDKLNNVEYWVNGNLSYSKNEIVYMDEVPPNEPYMAQTGRSTGLNYGYRFDRFLQIDDFDGDGNLKEDGNGDLLLPTMPLGVPRPGDALFKDLNDDGVINGNDKSYFGYGDRPDYVIGLLHGLRWNNIEISLQWSAALNASRLIDHEYRNPFGSINSRMLPGFLAEGRWTEENAADARFPRLTFMNKNHYLETSDLWLMDASYVRLKVAEVSYTFKNKKMLGTLGMESIRVYANGYNLFTLFSDLMNIDIDPEGKPNAAAEYPNSRIYNLGVNLSF